MQINNNQLSKFLGITRQGIGKAIKESRLVKSHENKIDLSDNVNVQFCISHGKALSDIDSFVLTISEKKSKKPVKKEKTLKPVKEKPVKIKKVFPVVEIEKPIITEPNVIQKIKPMDIPEPNDDDLTSGQFENITGLPARMMNMSLKNLVIKYGTRPEIEKYVKILNMLFQNAEKDNKIKEKRIELIEKDFCTARLFQYLEVLNNRLLDYADYIVDKIISMTLADKDTASIKGKTEMKKDMSIQIKESQSKILFELESLLSKHEKDNNE